MSNASDNAEKAARIRRTPEQIATDALEAADKRLEKANARVTKANAEVTAATAEVTRATYFQSVARQHPDLPESLREQFAAKYGPQDGFPEDDDEPAGDQAAPYEG